MTFHPVNSVVLCKLVKEASKKTEKNGILFVEEQVPEYQIIELGQLPENAGLKTGDIIITNSIPTKVKSDEDFYLIEYKYIMGKL